MNDGYSYGEPQHTGKGMIFYKNSVRFCFPPSEISSAIAHELKWSRHVIHARVEVGRRSVRLTLRGTLFSLQLQLPPPAPDVQVFWCGPPAFNSTVRTLVGELGYTDDMVHEFS